MGNLSKGIGKSSSGMSKSPAKSVSGGMSSKSISRSASKPSVSRPSAPKPSISRPSAPKPCIKTPTSSVSKGISTSASKPVARPTTPSSSNISNSTRTSLFSNKPNSAAKPLNSKAPLGTSNSNNIKPVNKSIKNNSSDPIFKGSSIPKDQIKSIGGSSNSNKPVSKFGVEKKMPFSEVKGKHVTNGINTTSNSLKQPYSTSQVSTGRNTTGIRVNNSTKSIPLTTKSIVSGLSLLDDGYNYNNYYTNNATPYYGGVYADQYYAGALVSEIANQISSRMASKEYQEKILLARIACCFYVAYADNMIAEAEKNTLDYMLDTVFKSKKVSLSLRTKVKELANTRITSFVQAESYFQDIEPEDLIPLISLAEDLADSDNAITNEELKAVTRIRAYVSNVTGYDFNDSSFDENKYQDDLLLAKLAVCTYIAYSDDRFSDEERNEAGTLINQILKNGSVTGSLKDEVQSILNNEDRSFFPVEKYLNNIKDEDLIPIVTLADEIADKCDHISIDEYKNLNQLKVYISNRTNQNFIDIEINDGDLVCNCCSGMMDITPGNILICPFCGNKKTLNKDSEE